jgi:hypothetical protein
LTARGANATSSSIAQNFLTMTLLRISRYRSVMWMDPEHSLLYYPADNSGNQNVEYLNNRCA